MAMTVGSQIGKTALATVLTGFLGTMLSTAQTLPAAASANEARSAERQHIINLKDVDITILLDDISTITGYTFVVHPSVRGKVSVVSQTPLTTDEVFQVFLSTLRVQGFAAIPGPNGVYKIVPEQSATAEAALASPSVGGDQVETAVFSLENINAVEAAKMIKPVTNAQGQVIASSVSNSVIVVDYATNIARVRSILADIDQDRSSIVTVSLENMSAAEMAKTVNGLQSGTNTAFNLDVGALAIESNNSIVLRGEDADVLRMAQMVRDLDITGAPRQDTLKVIKLRYASAADLAPVIDAIGARMALTASPAGGLPIAPAVVVHEPTNSLVLSADPVMLRQLEGVIDDLDQRRQQILVEAIVVELSDDAVRELGVQFVLADADGGDVPFAATNFSRATPNVLALAGALITDDFDGDGSTSGLGELALNSLLGTQGGILGFGSSNSDGTIFGAVINAVDEDEESNILQTPSVIALDNESASFLAGQEIPITTGEALGTDFQNPFRTVDRKEVGIKLEVTPQISDGNTIRLKLRQEVSSVDGVLTAATADLVTNKREIETTVLAGNGEIVVLGGLIEESEFVRGSKVPLLGDIPVIGRAFSSEGTARRRTNLMVFLRPTIVSDATDYRNVTASKYNFVVDAQKSASDKGRSSLEELVRRMEEEVER